MYSCCMYEDRHGCAQEGTELCMLCGKVNAAYSWVSFPARELARCRKGILTVQIQGNDAIRLMIIIADRQRLEAEAKRSTVVLKKRDKTKGES